MLIHIVADLLTRYSYHDNLLVLVKILLLCSLKSYLKIHMYLCEYVSMCVLKGVFSKKSFLYNIKRGHQSLQNISNRSFDHEHIEWCHRAFKGSGNDATAASGRDGCC